MARIDNRFQPFFGLSGPIFFACNWFLIEIKFIRYYIEMSTSENAEPENAFQVENWHIFPDFLVNSRLFFY